VYNITKHTRKFDLNKKDDLRDYDIILNDPQCQIIKEMKEKITHKDVDEEGRVTGYYEELILLVTWQKQDLLME
jgi:hypothetical protein